jgi:hypothetical protein
MRNAYKIFVTSHAGNRTFGRPRCRLDYNIKIDYMEIMWSDRAESNSRHMSTQKCTVVFHKRQGFS